jgi:mannitol-specific phosphotransferase system IIBC component
MSLLGHSTVAMFWKFLIFLSSEKRKKSVQIYIRKEKKRKEKKRKEKKRKEKKRKDKDKEEASKIKGYVFATQDRCHCKVFL